jgi:NADH-quinone oxidoreductase subunit L
MLKLIPLFPLLGFLVNGLWYALIQTRPGAKKAGSVVPGTIASLAILGSFIVSVKVFLQLKGMPEAARVVEETLFSWIQVGDLNVPMTLRVDVLSTLFTMVISGVGFLIHVYSIGYMSHDETPGKFFTYLNLFCFAMLMLVMGANLPILFLGWEGVGLCSYLLIGYWYTDDEKASAGKKAFIVNRIGDLGFLLGMFLIFTTFKTLDFAEIRQAFTNSPTGVLPAGVTFETLSAIGLLLFVGCMGKSAQIPLYVWLPDAMAGPTPVSALIHAATMVTSGIYLVARLNFLYSLAPAASVVVAGVGAFTAFMAATIAITQRDIKKVLAYSTVSQLGYMFLACGVGGYVAGVFHVITHAFFKALMFLGAGSVIHGMHEEQDIMKMGGLKSKMPQTFLVFLIGWLAICGLPPFSGFFSKDEILWLSFASMKGSKVLWAMGALTAVMTAFYMSRLFFLTFMGKPRTHEAEHAHESPFVMTGPLWVLAILSALGGFMGIPAVISEVFGAHDINWLAHWLNPVVPHHVELEPTVTHAMEWALMGLSVLGALVGIFVAKGLYRDLAKAEALQKKFAGVHKILTDKWYIDELYDAAIVRPLVAFSKFLWRGFDVLVIDGFVNGLGRVSAWTGNAARVMQTGSVQTYAIMALLGLLITVGYLVYGLA